MLYIKELQKNYLERLAGVLREKPEVIKHLNKEIYSPKYLSLSYRQINELSKSGLIKDKRKTKKKGWRKFSFNDAVYLETLFELKKARFTNKELINFKNSYYKNDDFEKALYLVFAGENIIVNINEKGHSNLFDAIYFFASHKDKTKKELSFSISLYGIVYGMLKDKPEDCVKHDIFYSCLDKLRKELADYPKEKGLSETDTEKLVEKIQELSEVLFERWISDKDKK